MKPKVGDYVKIVKISERVFTKESREYFSKHIGEVHKVLDVLTISVVLPVKNQIGRKVTIWGFDEVRKVPNWVAIAHELK